MGERTTDIGLRGKILFPFALLLGFVVAAFLVATYFVQARLQEATMDASTASVRQLLTLEKDRGAALMHAAMDALSRDKEVRRLLVARDRAGLLKRTTPLFEHIKAEYGITHLYFDTPDRVNVLRVHDPKLHGDTINRITTLEALKNGGGASGLEVGILGTLTLRTVVPWRDSQGRVIGLVEMGQDMSGLADQISRILGVNLVVTVRKNLVDEALWHEGSRALGQRATWDTLKDSLIVASTLAKLPPGVATLVESKKRSRNEYVEIDEEQRDLYVASLPISDVGNRLLGNVTVVRDITELEQGYGRVMAMVAAVSLVVAVLLFVLFSEILRRVDRDIRRKTEIENEFLKLSTEHERIIQIEKLSEVGRTIGEIAHQLNNPLVGVINLTQLAERTLDDSERTRGLLEEIRRAGEDCRSFVLRMLEFTRVSRSERRPTNLAAVIEDTVTLFRQSNATERPIRVDLEVEDVVLNLDPVLIRHALFNLVSNADAFSPEGAPITVRLHSERSDESDGWGLSVIDEGPGVAKEAIGKLFAPFFSTRHDGTGLGLPVTQHVAMSHDGWVSAHNGAEGGACFTLWLPADEGDD